MLLHGQYPVFIVPLHCWLSVFPPGEIGKHCSSLIRLLGERAEMKNPPQKPDLTSHKRKCKNKPQRPTKDDVFHLSIVRVVNQLKSLLTELSAACCVWEQVSKEAQSLQPPYKWCLKTCFNKIIRVNTLALFHCKII